MKTLKQIREEYNGNFINQEDYLPDEITLDEAKLSPTIPSTKDMPVVLVFRRVTYRTYPNKQTVALYYSKLVDKYLSIPFGPTGNLNLSEAEIVEGKVLDAIKGGAKGALTGALKGAAVGNVAHLPGMTAGAVVGGAMGAYKGAKKALQNEEELDEDWQSVNRKDKTDGLSQAAVNAYRRENPGSKLKTAVTEKNPTGKRAARRKSFCSRMGGMKKRLTSAKTARDPDSRINKALRRWNCEEEFTSKLNALREEKWYEKPWMDYSGLKGAVKTATELTPGASAYQKYKEGDYAGAAKSAAVDVALGGAAKLAGKALKFVRGSKAAKVATKARKAPPTTAPKPSAAGAGRAAAGGAAGAGAGATIAQKLSQAISGQSGGSSDAAPETGRKSGERIRDVSGAKTYSSFTKSPGSSPIAREKERQRLMNIKENKISDIRNMINEGIDSLDLPINGRQITLNTSMAKRILEVYDSVNTKNKKIVEGMLNDDLESFKKLLNFSIKA